MSPKTIVAALAAAAVLQGCTRRQADTEQSGGMPAPDEAAKSVEAAAPKAPEPVAPVALPAVEPGSEKTGSAAFDCNGVLPTRLRDEFLKGLDVEAGAPVNRTLACSAARDGAVVVHTAFDCRPTSTIEQFKQKAAEQMNADPTLKPVDGLGRFGFGAAQHVEFYDDDAACAVTVGSEVEGTDLTALARGIARVLNPAMVPTIERGRFGLDCEKLLPAKMRAKFVGSARVSADLTGKDQMTCNLALPALKVTSVNYDCSREYDAAFLGELKKQLAGQQRADPKVAVEDLPVGRAGFYTSVTGAHGVTFVDGETGCLVALNAGEGSKKSAIELARAIEKALTVASAR